MWGWTVQDFRSTEQVYHGAPERLKVRTGGVPTCYHDQVPPFLDMSEACYLPQPPLYFVSYNCFSHSLAHREAEPGNAKVIGARYKHQQAVCPASPVASCRGEVLRFGEALFSVHPPRLRAWT